MAGTLPRARNGEIVFHGVLWSIIVGIIFTGINSFVYNWIYLQHVYDKPFSHWALAKPEMFLEYWHWMPGRVICLVNVVLGALPFILWHVLKRQKYSRRHK